MADYTGYILGTQNIAFGSLNGRTISASITLGDATAASAGVVLVQGAAAVTLGGLTATSAGTVAVRGSASVTLGAVSLSSAGTVLANATTGQLAVTLGALSVASAGTVAEFVPSRERTKRVPSWPRVLLAENPDRVIELYRPPRTVRTAA